MPPLRLANLVASLAARQPARRQYDFSLLYSLPKETLERTLVVFTSRDPIQQTAAVHRVFCQLDPSRLCPGGVQHAGAVPDTAKCTKLSDFARRGFAGEQGRAGVEGADASRSTPRR